MLKIKQKGQIKKEFQNKKALLMCAANFGLLGDPTRVKICWLLCKHKELSVGEIAELLRTSPSVVSHSLKRMRGYNLVNARRSYRHVFYSFSKTSFSELLKEILFNYGAV